MNHPWIWPVILTADDVTGTLGSVSLADGQITYTAGGSVLRHIPANGTAADSFGYTASDQYGDIATGTVEVTITNPATVINGPEDGFGTIEAAASGASIINASGYSNIIYDKGGNDVVNAGSGQAAVYVDTGDVVVNLAGYGNLVAGFDEPGAAAATGADGNVRVSDGVYYTPPEVVRLIVAATDRALRQDLGTQGLLDPAVQLLDPACGTGTFLIGATGAPP